MNRAQKLIRMAESCKSSIRNKRSIRESGSITDVEEWIKSRDSFEENEIYVDKKFGGNYKSKWLALSPQEKLKVAREAIKYGATPDESGCPYCGSYNLQRLNDFGGEPFVVCNNCNREIYHADSESWVK